MFKDAWARLTFSDVNPLLKTLSKRQAELSDLKQVQFVHESVKDDGHYPCFRDALKTLRHSPGRAILSFERSSLWYMFIIHIIDVHIAVLAALLSVQVLKSFEPGSDKKLIHVFFTNPQTTQVFWFAAAVAFFVFLGNVFAASLHAQKIEREMRLSYRIQMRLTEYLFNHVLSMSRASRMRFQTGDLVNLAQSDARSMASFFSHAMVDFPVLFVSVSVILTVMLWMIGPAAWVGFFLVMSQFPISFIFSKVATRFNNEFMRRSDSRLSLVTEWVQGMRLVRYFGWRPHFETEIHKRVISEFRQDLKLKGLYCFAFSLSNSWWMFVSVGIFGAILYFDGTKQASHIFASIWLMTILGHQLTPLPWFVNIFAEARVASKRLRNVFAADRQIEEFSKLSVAPGSSSAKTVGDAQTQDAIRVLLSTSDHVSDVSIGFTFVNVTLRDVASGQLILDHVSIRILAGQTTAIVGPVGAGKSMLLQAMLGEATPESGNVTVDVSFTSNEKNQTISLNVHSEDGIHVLRRFQSVVFQEPFVANSSLRENVPLQYHAEATHSEFEDYSDNEINNALMRAQMEADLHLFPKKLDTELGERGVNLSGGQKQRLSLARSALLKGQLVVLDDPLSAVDSDTERRLVQALFDDSWKRGQTIVWSTHRLEFLNRAQHILFIEKGRIVEQGSLSQLMRSETGRLRQFIELSASHAHGHKEKVEQAPVVSASSAEDDE